MTANDKGVLAVMDAAQVFAFTEGEGDAARDMGAARVAVAELVEAANRAAIAAVRGDGNKPGTIRNADLDALRAALARVQGGAK